MAKLNVLKNRIKAIGSTHKITKTMDMVARSRTAKMLSLDQGMRLYTQKLNRIVEELFLRDVDNLHPLQVVKPKIKTVALFVITSTRGLCGSYNTKVFEMTMERIKHHKEAGREVQLHVVGKKGETFFEKQGIKIERKYPRITEAITFEDVEGIVGRFMHDYLTDKVSRFEVIYTRYYTRVVHIPKIKGLIPIVEDDEDIEGARKKQGGEYIIEPSKDEILRQVVPLAIKTSFYSMLVTSFLSENAERAIAMRNATENADRLLDDLKQEANRARQESITDELLDIIGGSEAINS